MPADITDCVARPTNGLAEAGPFPAPKNPRRTRTELSVIQEAPEMIADPAQRLHAAGLWPSAGERH